MSLKYDKALTNELISNVDKHLPRRPRGEDFKDLTDEQLDKILKLLTEKEYDEVSEILENRKLVISKGKRKKTRRKNKKGKKTRRRRR
tara:strand:+ start:79 stop:342 length:264 start_codon:yes stop_codon:yes gene_type:complete